MIRRAPCSSARSMSSPVPLVVAPHRRRCRRPAGQRQPAGPGHLDHRGALRPMRHAASTGAPSGPVTRDVRFAPPSTSRIPSPPSDIGTSSTSRPSSQHALPTAAHASAAVAVPRNLSSAATTRIGRARYGPDLPGQVVAHVDSRPDGRVSAMAVTVRIPTTLRPLSGGASTVEVEAGSLFDVIKALDAAHPGFGDRLSTTTAPAQVRQRLRRRRRRALPRRPRHRGPRRRQCRSSRPSPAAEPAPPRRWPRAVDGVALTGPRVLALTSPEC